MSFTNPAGPGATAAAPAYVRALLELLGSQEPMSVLPELVPWIEQRLRGLPDLALRRPEKPGKWSVIQIVQHLADTELVFAFRGRMILTDDRPALQGYDQDLWASTFRYAEVPLASAMGQLAALREANLFLWRELDARQLAREGLHSERGPESMGHLLKLMAAHDLVHRRQIDRVLGAAAG